MRISHLAAAVAVTVLLAGCEQRRQAETPDPAPAPAPQAEPAAPAAQVLAGFEHEAGFDASGYYMSQTPVAAGSYRLRNIAVGAPSDFSQWEAGGRTVFGPILFDFEDTASPAQVNELGGEYRTGSARVLPAAYRFGPGEVYFRGQAPQVGEVIFSGAFDQAVLAAARQSGSSEGRPVLTGSLEVDGERIRNISFHYWMGD